MNKQKIENLVKLGTQRFKELSSSQKIYASGIYFGIICFLSKIFPTPGITNLFLIICAFLISCGVIYDSLRIYKKLWSSSLGKGVILVVYALLTNLALAFSAQIVNGIIGIEPLKLVYTIRFVSVLMIPFMIVLCTAIILGLIFLFGQFYLAFAIFTKDLKGIPGFPSMFNEPYPTLTMFVRMICMTLIFGTVINLSFRITPNYEKHLLKWTKSFIYHFDSYDKSRCILKKGEKSIKLNDKEIVIVTKLADGTYDFKLRECKPRI